jgi:hypothetical protein
MDWDDHKIDITQRVDSLLTRLQYMGGFSPEEVNDILDRVIDKLLIEKIEREDIDAKIRSSEAVASAYSEMRFSINEVSGYGKKPLLETVFQLLERKPENSDFKKFVKMPQSEFDELLLTIVKAINLRNLISRQGEK